MNGQVRVTFSKEDFNKIVELTNISLLDQVDEKEEMKKFFDKIMTFSFIKDGRVTMNLYPSEARFLINLLNQNVEKIDLSKDWMKELELKKEEYKRKQEMKVNA